MGEISPLEIGPQSIGLRFREDAQFYQEIKRIVNSFTLGYACRKYFGISPTSGDTVRKILSREIISLERVLRFYERLKEERPNINIFNWMDEAEECIRIHTRQELDKESVKSYLKKMGYHDNKS